MAKTPIKRILLVGGGTGGHFYPLLAVAKELQEAGRANFTDIQLHYVGSPETYEKELAEAGIKIHRVMTGKLRRYFSLLNFLDIPKIFIGFTQALFITYWIMPDICFSKGGPGAFQAVLASWFYRVPVVIHESDAVPGLTTLLSARFAKKIAISFPSVAKYFIPPKVVLTGNPTGPGLLAGKLDPVSGKEALGFNATSPLILILGGSQGSEQVNNFVISILKDLINSAQILHQTGRANFLMAQKYSQASLVDVSVAAEVKNRYRPVAYLDMREMAKALSAADLVIARAGAATIFEISAFGKPAILVPLASAANDHQKENAYAYGQNGAAFVIEESNFAPQIFLGQIKKLLEKPETLKLMGEAALKFAKPDAAKDIANIILSLV